MIEDIHITGSSDEQHLEGESNELAQSGEVNRVWITTERESPVYLTKEDIYELGFLRSNPERKIYQHKDNTRLYLEEAYGRDYSIKEFVVERIIVYVQNILSRTVLYDSVKPNKEDIQQIIDNYAG